MMEVSQIKGQRFIKCPFEWGLENYVIIQTEYSGLLILVNEIEVVSQKEIRIEYEPVMKKDLPIYEGSKKQ